MNWKEYVAITGYTLLVILATVFCMKAEAGIVMQYQHEGRTIDVYVIPEQRRLVLRDRYTQEHIVDHEYTQADINKDEALHFYCAVEKPGGLSGLLVCD